MYAPIDLFYLLSIYVLPSLIHQITLYHPFSTLANYPRVFADGPKSHNGSSFAIPRQTHIFLLIELFHLN